MCCLVTLFCPKGAVGWHLAWVWSSTLHLQFTFMNSVKTTPLHFHSAQFITTHTMQLIQLQTFVTTQLKFTNKKSLFSNVGANCSNSCGHVNHTFTHKDVNALQIWLKPIWFYSATLCYPPLSRVCAASIAAQSLYTCTSKSILASKA